ncbi:EAL domain-containing protein [Herbaspirillum sp. LeCh32-8]|uniref:EAL domain-containing response regulator n=1 Tax=Herbaspirillum sp. LeCh32-8 TaxID=2821356 RepID=UPI001AE77148|nr:EAL domain-containing protein [Herbaspirillum sp. LeCh32-8]MBP0596595.1 EAL domain-containing protein [Herbaspirillum sp. LeCh32-8]
MKFISDLAILIVEDEPLQRAFLAEKLRQLSAVNVHEASDGGEAIQVMAEHPIDLIFCDIGMPRMDGPQFILKQQECSAGECARRSLPMLVWMSVLGPGILESHSRLARLAGFEVFDALTKPLSSAQLSYVLELAVALKNARRHKRLEGDKLPVVNDDDLLRAICDADEFDVWYRPTISLESGLIIGAQAEVRWNHPKFRQLRTEQFMTLTEQQGLGLVLFYRTVNHVLAIQRKLKDAGCLMPLGIRASAQTLQTPEIADYLADRVRQQQLCPDQISVLLTEGAAPPQMMQLSASLNRLRIKGFRLVLSGFGAGGANMNMLAELPFNGICIDDGLIGQVVRHAPSRAIVDVMVAMGRRLGLTVIADGVAGRETCDAMQQMGGRLVQGDLAPPLKSADFLQAVRKEHEENKRCAMQPADDASV